MAVTLAPNQAPPGTRKGSPITIVDTFTDNGQTKSTCAVPIYDKAIPGQDVVVAIMGFAHDGFGHFLGSFSETPSPALNNDANIQDAPTSNGTAQSKWFSRVVQPGDPGRDFNFSWSADVFVSWALIVYTLRFVDLGQIYDTGFFFNFSVADIIFSSTLAGVYNTNTDNALIISEITAEAGPVNTGIGPGPLPGWYNLVDANSGQQPNLGLVSGIVDMPTAGRWLGASCAWSQGNPGGFGAPCDFAAITVAMKPMPAPSAPTVTISPPGPIIDAAQFGGVPFTVNWAWTPVRGQGEQEAWLIAREPHGGGTDQFWNADFNRWETSEYWNASTPTARSYTFPPSAFSNAAQWDLYVAVRESHLHYHSPLSAVKTFTASTPPSLTSVTVTNPNNVRPTVNWVDAPFPPQSVGFDFEDGTTQGWGPVLGSCDVQPNQIWAHTGTWSCRLAVLTNPNAQARSLTGTSGIPVTPGTTGVISGWFRAKTAGRGIRFGIAWYNSSGTQLSTSETSGMDSPTSDLFLSTTVTAPAGSAFYALYVVVSGTVATGEIHRWDSVGFSAISVQTAYHVKVFEQSQTLDSLFDPANSPAYWDSGVVSSAATSTAIGIDLVGGAEYVAYVQITMTGGGVSSWAPVNMPNYQNSPASASWWNQRSLPAVPAFAATTGADPVCGVTRTRLYTSGIAVTGDERIQCSDDNGATWSEAPVWVGNTRYTDVIPVSGSTLLGHDYEVAPNSVRRYRARLETTATTPVGAGLATVPIHSDWSAIIGVTSEFTRPALVDPLNPPGSLLGSRFADTSAGAVPSGFTSSMTIDRPEQQTVVATLGRSRKVVSRGELLGSEFNLNLWFFTEAELETFYQLRDNQRVLLFQSDMTQHYYISLGATAPASVLRIGDRQKNPVWTLSVACTEVDAPA